jgi:sialic acid synthase SpsE
MKIKYFAEIGLNYLGKSRYIDQYLDKLCKSNIDGVTIQVLNNNFYKDKFKSYKISNSNLIKFVQKLKKNKKLVGFVTNDLSNIRFLKKFNVDFFKVLSSNINDHTLIKNLLASNAQKIYLSTGLANYKKINNILKKIKTNIKKLSLIHTSFKKEKKYINLNRINLLKRKYNLPICYGNHSKYLGSIIDAKKYQPYAIFFYVKLNKKLSYPDNIHAIELKKIKQYIL